MLIFRLLMLLFTAGMAAITLILGVSVMLGVGWLAVAVPVLIVTGLVAAGRAFWRRYVGRD